MLVSRNNPRIKYIRRLARRRFREQEGKFLAEGIRFLEEAIRENWPLELALHAPGMAENPRGAVLLADLERLGVPLLAVDGKLLDELAETEHTQGIVAVAQMPRRRGLADGLVPGGEKDLWVLVDSVRDPGNLGTIIRCADACGAGGVFLLPGTVDPYNPKTLRATMGAVFRVPLVRVDDPAGLVTDLGAGGWKLVAGDPAADKYLQHCDLTGPVVLAVGGEAAGFSGGLTGARPDFLRIPMPGRAESLNAGVAACIMLYEAVRQRMEK